MTGFGIVRIKVNDVKLIKILPRVSQVKQEEEDRRISLMKYMIDGYNFFEMEAEKYFAPPSSWSQEKKKEWAINRIFSGEWYGALKRDGAFFMFLKDEDGNMFLRPRSRNVKKEFVNKIDWVPQLHEFFNKLPNGTCFLGELYDYNQEEAKRTTSIMNCLVEKAIKRQEKDGFLIYYIFDILAYNGRLLIDEPAIERFKSINNLIEIWGPTAYDAMLEYIEWAEYLRGEDLWESLQDILSRGYEGVVITRGDSHYLPGKRTNRDTLKIKKELQDTIDCVMIGAESPTKLYNGKETETWTFWFDELNNEKITAQEYLDKYHTSIYTSYVEGGPVYPVTKNWFYGWAGSWKLGAYKDGKLIQIGKLSGLTDEMKENWKNYVGSVVEVSCMEIMDNEQGGKGLRHPKLISIRSDKDKTECLWEDIFK